MSTIIPKHDNVDIEAVNDAVTISQRVDGEYQGVTFHKRYIDDVIRALAEARGPSEQELMEAEMRSVMAAWRNEVSA